MVLYRWSCEESRRLSIALWCCLSFPESNEPEFTTVLEWVLLLFHIPRHSRDCGSYIARVGDGSSNRILMEGKAAELCDQSDKAVKPKSWLGTLKQGTHRFPR